MRRNIAILGFVLSSLWLAFGFVACENVDLETGGHCGNGVVGGREDCDGTVPSWVTCESLGHYDGVVRCGADCRFNVTGCRRCGDGVLDVDEGERYEVGLETCLRTGFMGGDHQTPDCWTFHPETCVNYRTVSQDPPVSRPVLGLDALGRLWLSGQARSAFPSHEERPGCPIIKESWGWSCSKGCGGELNGYYIDPACDQEFLAFYDDEGLLDVSPWQPDEGTTGRLLALDDGKVVLVRKTPTHTEFVAMSVFGTPRRHTFLENASLPDRWSVAPLADGRLGIGRLRNGLMNWLLLDPLLENATDEFDFSLEFHREGVDYVWYPMTPLEEPDFPGASLLTAWEVPEALSFLVELRGSSDAGTTSGWTWVRLQREDGLARVTHLVSVPSTGTGLVPFHLQVDPETGTFSVAWKSDGLAFHLQRFTWMGELLASWRYALRQGRTFEALFPTDDGGIVVAGTVSDFFRPIPFNDSPCSELGNGYFAERLDAQGARVSETVFTAPGISLGVSWKLEEEICDLETRAWVFDGNRVTVGGTHLRDRPFCDPSEVLPTYWFDPFLLCDIHLVQLTP